MPKRGHQRGIAEAGIDQPADNGLPFGLKTIVPTDAEAVLDTLSAQQASFEQVIPCGICDVPLKLRTLKVLWPAGPFTFYFPGAPAYRCAKCDRTYFPEAVHQALAESVERELDQRKPEPPLSSPRARAFNGRFSRV